MSRYIDADTLKYYGNHIGDEYEDRFHDAQWAYRSDIDSAPSIDIVFCYDCEFENTRKCPPHRMGLIHDATDYCSYGIRRTDNE